MLKLYEYGPSGNSYKVKHLLSELGQQAEIIHMDILKGETRTEDFLNTKSPNGRIPVLELEDGKTLWESHAILFYLAEDTKFMPSDPWQRAKVMQWLCFEQYNLEPNIAVARFWLHVKAISQELLDKRLPRKMTGGYQALDILEGGLQGKEYLVGDFSIADIGLFGYTHVASEGGFDLARYTNISAWIDRIMARPRFTPL